MTDRTTEAPPMDRAALLAQPNFSRADAAAWFALQGYKHVTVVHLEHLADTGRGPKRFKLGKFVYYSREAPEDWLAAELARAAAPARGRRRRAAAA